MLLKNKIGIGTGGFGMDADEWEKEKSSIRYALDLGYNIIDTAQIYAHGNCEVLVGESITGYDRSKIQIITKVLPFDNPIDCLYDSLKRMNIDYIDMYMLHWFENTDMEKTINDFIYLLDKQLIKSYAVSNFSLDMILAWTEIENRLGVNTSANQLHISRTNKIDNALLTFHRKTGIQTIASSPLNKGSLTVDSLEYVKSVADTILIRSKNFNHIETNYKLVMNK